jgi:hypothetical protein
MLALTSRRGGHRSFRPQGPGTAVRILSTRAAPSTAELAFFLYDAAGAAAGGTRPSVRTAESRQA